MTRIFLGFAAISFLTAAGPLPDHNAQRYAACIAEAQQQPKAAVESASQWRDAGGGAPAKHCLGMALFAMGQAKNAALAFAQAAGDLENGKSTLESTIRDDSVTIASLYSQAGNASLVAEDPATAYQHFSRALTIINNRPGDMRGNLLLDRARALAAMKDYTRAKADLDKAAEDLPSAGEVWILRAAAKRKLGDLPGAEADAAQALAVAPGDPDALLERAAIFALKGDLPAAKTDWEAIVKRAPDSEAASVARANLKNGAAAAQQ